MPAALGSGWELGNFARTCLCAEGSAGRALEEAAQSSSAVAAAYYFFVIFLARDQDD